MQKITLKEIIIGSKLPRCLLTFTMMLFSYAFIAQNVSVSGTVSADGEPLIGAAVQVKGTTDIGTITDFNGAYTLSVPSTSTLVFSYLGHETQEIAVANQPTINVQLLEASNLFDEIVVVGFGSMERTNVTGAITTVNADVLEKTPVANPIEALRGQAAGVRITRGSGAPGSGVSFRVRGTNSIGVRQGNESAAAAVNRSNSPLIIVDGVPITGGSLTDFNPNDIKSINILKDAAAASVYGSGSANGVVLITTKSGQGGKAKISFNYSHGVTSVARDVDIMNAEQYVQFKRDAKVGTNGYSGDYPTFADVIPDPIELQNFIDGKSVDWNELLLKNGAQDRIGLQVSGGTDKFTYFVSGDAYLETGIVPSYDFNRYSIRSNTSFKATSWLDIGTRIQLSDTRSEETGAVNTSANTFNRFLGNSPLGRVTDENGNVVSQINSDQFQYNPQFKWQESQLDRHRTRVQFNPYISAKISSDLNFRINGNIERRTNLYKSFSSSIFDDGSRAGAARALENRSQENTTFLLDNILTYNKQLGNNSLNATAVVGMQQYGSNDLRVRGTGIQPNAADGIAGDPSTFDLLGYYGLGTIQADRLNVDTGQGKWSKLYMIGRVGYTINDKYVINATIRRDGSSRFGPNERWGNFPSVSVAWNLDREGFIENIGAISSLKLRTSYGQLGQDAGIGNFSYLSTAATSNYFFGSLQSGFTTNPNSAPNADLRWETSTQFNVGLDYGFIQNRLNGSIDYYNTKTTDLLLSEILPVTSGYTAVTSNVGATANWGIDMKLSANIIQKQDFNWTSTVNWATDHNKIVSLNRASVDEEGNPIDDVTNGWFIGERIDVIYDYEFDGIYQLGEEALAAEMHPGVVGYGAGDQKIVDTNGDGVITSDDRTFLGQSAPKWYGGWNNTFNYKGFELGVLIEGVYGVTRNNGYLPGLEARTNAANAPFVEYWTPDNPSNEIPQPSEVGADISNGFGNIWRRRDASFISIRNISLGYNLPQKILEGTKISKVNLYVLGNNLHYFTNYGIGYSPEQGGGAFPITTIWTGGANVSF